MVKISFRVRIGTSSRSMAWILLHTGRCSNRPIIRIGSTSAADIMLYSSNFAACTYLIFWDGKPAIASMARRGGQRMLEKELDAVRRVGSCF